MIPLACRAAFAVAVASASVALAQPMPTAPPMPNAQPMPQLPAMPQAAAGGAEERLNLPDYIRPGARLVYSLSSVAEPEDPQQRTTAGAGIVLIDVVAVTPTRVYLSSSNFLQEPDGSQKLGSTVTQVMRSADVVGGGAYWMPKEVLAGFTTSGPLTVQPMAFERDGKTFTSTSLTWRGDNSVRRTVWDGSNGLLLSMQQATGQPLRAVRGMAGVSEFQRQSNSILQFVSSRLRALPWFGAAPPAWARTARRITYQGQITMSVPGGTPISLPMRRTFEITERGDGYLVGQVSDQTQGLDRPSVATVAVGPASCDGPWIAPAALAAMRPGVVDQEPAVASTITYEVKDGPMSRAGVLNETNAAGNYRLQRAYRLEDGALVYFSLTDPSLGRTTEFSLVSIE